MSSTTAEAYSNSHAFDHTVADLKEGVAAATAAQTEASERVFKTAKDLVAFNQGTLQAVTQASQILAAGSQDLAKQMVASGQSAFAEFLSGLRALALAQTARERIELQAGLASTAAHWTLSESGRFAKAGLELTEKASAPLTARAALAAEAFAALKP
jgi:hypothetical protein